VLISIIKKLSTDKQILSQPKYRYYADGNLIMSWQEQHFYARVRKCFAKKLILKSIVTDIKILLRLVLSSPVILPYYLLKLNVLLSLSCTGAIDKAQLKLCKYVNNKLKENK
jgi:hypothetical protein